MSRVVVFGAGGQGRQTIDVLEAGGVHAVVGVVDPGLATGARVAGHPVVDPAELAALGADGFVVAVGDNVGRASVAERVRTEHPALELVAAVHPAAVVARDAVVGAGATLMAGVVVANGCTVGDGSLLGTNASLDHDGVLGPWASLAPGVATGGNVTIGAFSAIGVGAALIHGVTVGPHSVVGAGAVVLRDVPDHVVAHGVPAAVVRTRTEGEPYLHRPGG